VDEGGDLGRDEEPREEGVCKQGDGEVRKEMEREIEEEDLQETARCSWKDRK
jgi:hypothetical protein